MYYVYLLQSELDGTYYIGYTNEIDRRLQEHNEGRSRYTSKKKPWKLVYTEKHATKREALIRERFLKSQRNKKFYDGLRMTDNVG